MIREKCLHIVKCLSVGFVIKGEASAWCEGEFGVCRFAKAEEECEARSVVFCQKNSKTSAHIQVADDGRRAKKLVFLLREI